MLYLCAIYFRELRELRVRYEGLSHELKRKEMQVKELQNRLDDGCKSLCIYTYMQAEHTGNTRSSLPLSRSN